MSNYKEEIERINKTRKVFDEIYGLDINYFSTISGVIVARDSTIEIVAIFRDKKIYIFNSENEDDFEEFTIEEWEKEIEKVENEEVKRRIRLYFEEDKKSVIDWVEKNIDELAKRIKNYTYSDDLNDALIEECESFDEYVFLGDNDWDLKERKNN